jgi:type II secretory pathway pseudopilin PulG
MSLIELLIAFAILSVAILGLTSGLVIASGSNGLAATRTQMSEFALSRLERIAGQDTSTLCSGDTDFQAASSQSCTEMAVAPTPFNPDVPPNTGGWMMDVVDWPAPVTGAGDDAMFGPVVVMGDANSVDVAATLTARATAFASWSSTGTTGTGCDSAQVRTNPAILCREIHVERANGAIGDGGTGNVTPMLSIWVRVLRGGTTDFRAGSVTLQALKAQK